MNVNLTPPPAAAGEGGAGSHFKATLSRHNFANFQDLAQDNTVGRLFHMGNLNKITPRNTQAGAQALQWKHAEPSLQALGEVTVSLHPAKGGHITNKQEFEHLQSPLQQKKTNSYTIGVSVSLLFPPHALMLQPELHSHWIKIALVKTFLAMHFPNV